MNGPASGEAGQRTVWVIKKALAFFSTLSKCKNTKYGLKSAIRPQWQISYSPFSLCGGIFSMDFFTTEYTEKREHFHHTTVIAKISLSFSSVVKFSRRCRPEESQKLFSGISVVLGEICQLGVPPATFTQDFHPKIPKFSA